jgi:hypothetical protein
VLYITLIWNPLLSILARVGSSIGSVMEGFPWGTQYYNNIKRYRAQHYASTSNFLVPLGGMSFYALLTLVYIISGKNLIVALFTANFLGAAPPLLRYFIYNRQVRNQISD